MTPSPTQPLGQSGAWRPSQRLWCAFFLVASVVLVADQASKLFAVYSLTSALQAADGSVTLQSMGQGFLWAKHPPVRDTITIMPSCFHLRYVENPGAAWGFLSRSASGLRTPFFLGVSLAAMGLVIAYFRRSMPHQRLLRLALALVFGGAVGNFLDRVRLGYVIDFIDWHLGSLYTWPTFNVADAGITVGAILLLIDTLRDSGARQRVAHPSPLSTKA